MLAELNWTDALFQRHFTSLACWFIFFFFIHLPLLFFCCVLFVKKIHLLPVIRRSSSLWNWNDFLHFVSRGSDVFGGTIEWPWKPWQDTWESRESLSDFAKLWHRVCKSQDTSCWTITRWKMDHIGPNIDHKGLKILIFVPKIPFCGNFCFRRRYSWMGMGSSQCQFKISWLSYLVCTKTSAFLF